MKPRRVRYAADWSLRVRRCGSPARVPAVAAELASKHWAGHDVKACAQVRLAALLRCSVRTVQRALAWLRDHGWLLVDPAVDGHLALYTLTVPKRANQGATTGAPSSEVTTRARHRPATHTPGQTSIRLELARTTAGRPAYAARIVALDSGRPAGDG